MVIEYVPFANRSDIQFLFEASEVLSFVKKQTQEASQYAECLTHKVQVQAVMNAMNRLVALEARLTSALKGESAQATWAELGVEQPEGLAADLLEQGLGLVSCPCCQRVYTADELYLYDESSCNITQRLFTCPQDHRLHQTTDRIGEAKYTPYQRHRRERQAPQYFPRFT